MNGLFANIFLLFKLGIRNIFRNTKRSLLLIATAMVGVIGILFTMATINALTDSILKTGINTGLGHLQIRPKGYYRTSRDDLFLDKENEIRILLLKFPTPHSARLEREGMIRVGSYSQGLRVIGIEPKSERSVSSYSEWLTQGKFLEDFKDDEKIDCMISEFHSKKMEIGVGDWVILSITGLNGELNSIRIFVKGIFHSPSDEIDKYTILINREVLSNLYFGDKKHVSYFVFLGKKLEASEKLKNDVKKILNSLDGVEILSYKDLQPGIVRLMEISSQFTWISHLIIMIGFAFILFDSITLSVFDRMREIGVLRAIGTSDLMLFFMILFESVLVTMIGCVMGIIIGGIVIFYFYFQGLSLEGFSKGLESIAYASSMLHPYISLIDIFEAILISFFISLFAGIYPAIKAIRVVPIKAIYNR